MDVEEIQVIIEKDGRVRVEVRGVKGNACLSLTQALEEALGGQVEAREMTPEAYEEAPQRIDNRQKQKGREVQTPQSATHLAGASHLRIHHFLSHSRANGPGIRAVVWVQGCTLGCAGCFNPQTHPSQGGEWLEVGKLFAKILALGDRIEGVTISGGEPLQQADALLSLVQRIHRETRLSTLLFTGFTWEEIGRLPQAEVLLGCIDVVLAGRYEASQRLAHGLLGSANKTVHLLSSRYTMEDLAQTPEAEAIITPQGEILLSGINPLSL